MRQKAFPYVSIHAPVERRRTARRPDRRVASINTALAAMRRGEQLHLRFENGRAIWSLSGGRNVATHIAALVMSNPSVVPAGDSLFPDSLSQTWRLVP